MFQSRQTTAWTGSKAVYSEGLRKHMLKVYNYMTLGLALTTVIALSFASLCVGEGGQLTTMGSFLFQTPFKFVVIFAPLALAMLFGFRYQAMSLSSLQMVYWLYAGAMGVSMSTIFMAFPKAEILNAFLVSALTFGSMSLWGYTTKRDLSGMGSLLTMALFGIIIASLVNLFLQSGMMQFIISCIGVLVFTGLTAYDTQKVKEVYLELEGSGETGKAAVAGALTLYMDFVNLFISLLQVMRGSSEW